MLLSYLLSGRNKFSLVDQRKNNSRPKNSHSKDYENPRNDVDEILKYGLKMFVKYGKPGMAYDAVLRRYFREPVEAPDGSSVKMVTLPEEERSVSYKMLYNYIRKHTEDYSCMGKMRETSRTITDSWLETAEPESMNWDRLLKQMRWSLAVM